MSWRFSQVLVEEFLQATCSDGEQFAQLSKTNMPQMFLSPGKTMGLLSRSRYGTTYAHLTGNRGEDLLTWFLADSHVRTYQLLDEGPELTASGLAFGEKWQESSVRYSQDTCLWKTHLCLFSEDLPWSSVTLPKWGTMRNGVVYQHKTLVRPISATGSGLWPTPVASMSKGSSVNCLTRKSGKSRAKDRLDHAVMSSDGGHLNPDWTEWLMGWPIGHADLKPLGTDKFQEWRRQHSPFCSEG